MRHRRPGDRNGRLRVGVAVAITLAAAATANAQNLPNQSTNRFNYGSRLGQAELPPGSTVEPRVDTAVQYADNTDLSSSGGSSAFGLELAPGIYAAYNTQRFVGAVDYSLIGRAWDNGDFDDLTHALDANGRWNAIRDLLFFDGDATYSDTVLDFSNGSNYGGLGVFNTSNLAEQATFSVGPTLQKQFKDFLFDANYHYGRTWLLNVGKGAPTPSFGSVASEDSEDQRAMVSLGANSDRAKLFGKVFYSWERSDFEVSLPYEFERAGFDGGFELSRTLSVVGDVGKESQLDENASSGGLDSDFWSAGLKWQPSSKTSAEARYGDRFFGDSYQVEISHTSRLLEVLASYAEAPQVDTRRRSMGQFQPGELPPVLDDALSNSIFNSQPFVGKDGSLALVSKGYRTYLSLNGYTTERNYIDDFFGDEEGIGIAFLGNRAIAANLSVDVQANYTDYKRAETVIGTLFTLPKSHDYDTEITIRGNRDFGPQLVASLEAGFFNRAGTNDYSGWWIGVRGRWYPDFHR